MPERKSRRLTNSNLFLYALYRLGGAGRFVDIEDVFIEMWKISPGRFGWRKYPYPHYKIAHTALVDIAKPSGLGLGALLLSTSDRLGRQLTADGVEWVEDRLQQIQDMLGIAIASAPDRRPSQRTLVDLTRTSLFRAFQTSGRAELGRDQLAEMLRIPPDAPRAVWLERLETLRSAAAMSGREEVSGFLDYVAEERAGWFGGRE
jgi:hypothetical protein